MEHELKQVVAELFEADLHAVNADFLLSTRRMQGSLARAKLDAAIRHRLGVKCRGVYSAQTYGELQEAVLGVSSNGAEADSASLNVRPVATAKPSVISAENRIGSAPVLSCGIDIEMVDSFPEVDDYWKDAFYTNSFSSVEIAYCLLQEHPRMHFAARWCAKEALKKCQPLYLHEEMNHFELLSRDEGPPIFQHFQQGTFVPIPFAVSISHTPYITVAMVVSQVSLP
ncbi:MAG: 4'-phosphopantetheinyl transferase superfamily protein [Nitrospirales bacterium]